MPNDHAVPERDGTAMWFVLIILALFLGYLAGHDTGFDDGVKVGEGRVRDQALRSAIVCNIWFGTPPKEPDFACDQLNEIAKGAQ